MLSTDRYTDMIKEFFRMESAGGLMLVIAAMIAMGLANSPYAGVYTDFLQAPVQIKLGALDINKPLLLWINDGLMAVFFFLVGMEIKREFLDGELSSFSSVALPGFAAVGGMIVPALIYVALNWSEPSHLNGWAIPAATDIAFALGVVALLGSRVPTSLKALLLAIAIFDDLGAIVIIAAFYTDNLAVELLGYAGGMVALLAVMNIIGVKRILPYIIVGVILWVLVLKSGVHATVAGVLVGFAIPLGSTDEGYHGSPLKTAEHALHPWVAFGILPLFAFANAGVSLVGIGLEVLTDTVTLGIALGLFVGKQLGVYIFMLLALGLGFASMPKGGSFGKLYGIAALTGIGFTMSLFIGSLAFQHSDFDAPIRLGVIAGSLMSAAVGAIVLMMTERVLVED